MRSDEQLIKKIKRRSDREAADELLQRYYRDIYAFIFRQVSQAETLGAGDHGYGIFDFVRGGTAGRSGGPEDL